MEMNIKVSQKMWKKHTQTITFLFLLSILCGHRRDHYMVEIAPCLWYPPSFLSLRKYLRLSFISGYLRLCFPEKSIALKCIESAYRWYPSFLPLPQVTGYIISKIFSLRFCLEVELFKEQQPLPGWSNSYLFFSRRRGLTKVTHDSLVIFFTFL